MGPRLRFISRAGHAHMQRRREIALCSALLQCSQNRRRRDAHVYAAVGSSPPKVAFVTRQTLHLRVLIPVCSRSPSVCSFHPALAALQLQLSPSQTCLTQ